MVSQVRGDVEDGQAEAGSPCADGPVDNPLADTAALDGTGVEGVAARRAQVEREPARKTPVILHAKSPKHAGRPPQSRFAHYMPPRPEPQAIPQFCSRHRQITPLFSCKTTALKTSQ